MPMMSQHKKAGGFLSLGIAVFNSRKVVSPTKVTTGLIFCIKYKHL